MERPDPIDPDEPEHPHSWRDRAALWLGGGLLFFGLVTGFIAFTMVRSHSANPFTSVVNYFVPSPESVFGKERINVLLVGLDYSYDKLDQPTSKDARTDKIEVFALDFPSHVIKSVAVPRDMDALVGGHEDKINSAWGLGGWRGSDDVIGTFLGLPKTERGTYFDRYIALRINASKDVIDAIGGLDVPVTEKLDYDDTWGHLHIHFKPGLTHMSGDQAVSYARFRHDACSDPCRIKRQQQIEHLTIEKLKRDKFNDLTHIAGLVDVIRKNVYTNLTPDEMKSLGWHFRDVNMADVHSTQVPFSSDKDLRCCGNVLVADTAALAKIMADFTGPFFGATPPPGADALAAVKPATLTIDVRNGSGVPGMGRKLADALRQDGYVIANVGNADSFDYETTQIRALAKTPLAGERVRSDLHLTNAAVSPMPEPAASATATKLADVTIVVGRDYVKALAAATPAPAASAKI